MMPPKPKFTRAEIVDAALSVARRKGAAAVTTRDIGAVLGVSTRPIFTYFASMDEVRVAMREAAQALYQNYIAEGLRMKIPFLGVGMQYIRFARSEPELYKMLFLAKDSDALAGLESMQAQICASIMSIYNMDEPSALRFSHDMWLVVYGISAMIVTGGCAYTDDEIRVMLTGFSVAVCKACKEVPGFVENEIDRNAVFEKLIGE